MSYSRWSKDSVWYTFWSSVCSPDLKYKFPTTKLKDGQCFEICDDPSYYISYGQLKTDGLKKVVSDAKIYFDAYDKPTQFSDYTKLRWQLICFMTDVDEHFQWKNFFMYSWYYPIRNRIVWKWKCLIKNKKNDYTK